MIFTEKFISDFLVEEEVIAVDDLDRQLSRRELFNRALKLAKYFKDEGLSNDDHISILVSNRTEYIEIILASVFAGLWLTPINWHLTESEISYVLEDSGCCLLILENRFKTLFVDINTSNYKLLNIDVEYEDILNDVEKADLDSQSHAGGVMMYTSGTTGLPKGVKRRRPGDINKTFTEWATTGNAIGLDGSGPHLITGPMYHAAPLMYALYDFLNGSSLIIMQTWNAERALCLIEDYGVVHTHCVPTMFSQFLRNRSEFKRDYDLSSLTLVLHGAAPIAMQLKKRMHNWWGVHLVEYWGGTESGLVTKVNKDEWEKHAGTVGRPLPHFEVFAVNSEGLPLSSFKVGLLYIRHKHTKQPFSYHEDLQKTKDSYLRPGVFTLGDLGYTDDDGYVYLSDRRSNLIISGGVNIYPAEIEKVLAEHPAVSDVAVFGMPDEEWGQSVHAAIKVDRFFEKENLIEELKALAESKLARFKLPRQFYLLDNLPRYESGKLYMSQLREMLGFAK
tara:strand:- start:568 stop:2082 length:1515 start_codon:yes stop_codon:yes gene_type:complete